MYTALKQPKTWSILLVTYQNMRKEIYALMYSVSGKCINKNYCCTHCDRANIYLNIDFRTPRLSAAEIFFIMT